MRVAVTLALMLAAARIVAADECPSRLADDDGHVLYGWKPNTTIHYAFDGSMNVSSARSAANMAFTTWTDANVANRTNIRFEPAAAGSTPDLLIINAYLNGTRNDESWTAGYYRPLEKEDYHPTRANIYMNLDVFDPTADGYFDALYKVMLHEIGHSMGLGHPTSQGYHGSIMNSVGNVNDIDDWMPAGLTGCDKDHAGEFNGFFNGPGAGNPKRPKPPRMPKDADMCNECRIVVSVYSPDFGTYHLEIRDGYCCGTNNSNGEPRYPDQFPSLAFRATGYECADDGWMKFRCAADMCCVHPDDVPEGALDRPLGTTCAEQGWWNAEQGEQCAAAWNEPCIKKEQCGTGQCTPWPGYCWKEPHNAPTHPDPEPAPTSGVYCSAKGWYDGNDLAACERDHGSSCTRKQDCDGQTCLPAPFYCWRPD